MEDAELYAKYSSMQRQTTVKVMQEYAKQLRWSKAEHVLDVGCGPGDVTAEVILPHLPRTAVLVAENLFSLLRPGGEFLIVTAPFSPEFEVFRLLGAIDKWKPHMKDQDQFMPRFHDSGDACSDIRRVLTVSGLEVVTCEEWRDVMYFPNKETLMRSNEAVMPFVLRMPEGTKQEFMANYDEVIDAKKLYSVSASGELLTENAVIVVYGRRPRTPHVNITIRLVATCIIAIITTVVLYLISLNYPK